MPGLKARAAPGYAAEHMPKVAQCRADPRVPIDSNGPGRRSKAFATGRKNRRVCDTPAGAEASACMCSPAGAAKANGLEPRARPGRVLAEMPRPGGPQALSDGDVARLLPWSEEVPEGCRQLTKPRS